MHPHPSKSCAWTFLPHLCVPGQRSSSSSLSVYPMMTRCLIRYLNELESAEKLSSRKEPE